MKKILLLFTTVLLLVSCNDDFLERYPKGRWHHGNYTSDKTIDKNILVQAKLSEAYGTLRGWSFVWANLAMNNYTTPDVEKGSTPSDGGEITQFKSLSYTASNENIADYYSACYKAIYFTNEALVLATALEDSVPNKQRYVAEALFLRSVMYYRLTQAFGGVPFIDKVLGQNDKTPPRSTREEIWKNVENDLLIAIPLLPTRSELLGSNNLGRATQNAARAILAKVYMYQKNWSSAMSLTSDIIASGDNDLTTPYDEIFTEVNEFNEESVFEVFCEERPSEQIYMGSQFAQVQGIRGIPNLGWGFNAPSQVLMDAFEPGDPRKTASVIADGDVLEEKKIKADASGYKFFNKKAYTRISERGKYGRPLEAQGTWVNIRIIRYADVLLMHAESACELGNTNEALEKLEMVRARARGGDNTILPKVTTTVIEELRAKIHQERRIELAMEWERFYDLVRWDEAKDVIPNFIVGKHELFPIPQTEIDKSEGILTQNPGY